MILIQGCNNDNTSATSNGAGKSSIVDALAWVLYGTTARGYSGDEVINATAKKGTAVTVKIDDDGVSYQITRYRKHPTGKNSLQVFGSGGDPLHKGTDRETQKEVDNIIGCSLEVFMAAIYAGQEELPNLPGLTDKELKLLIEEAAGTEVLSAAYQEALRRRQTVAEKLALLDGRVDTAVNNRVMLDNELTACDAAIAGFGAQQKEKARTLLVAMQDAIKVAEGIETALTAVDYAALRGERDGIDVNMSTYKSLSDIAAAMVRDERIKYAHHLNAVSNEKRARDALEKRKTFVGTVRDRIGSPCKECGKPHTAADIQPLMDAQRVQLTDCVASLAAECSIAVDAEKAYNAAKADAAAATAALPDVTTETARRAVLSKMIDDFEGDTRTANTYRLQAAEYRKRAKAELELANPHLLTKDRLTITKTTAVEALFKLREEQTALKSALNVSTDAVVVFSPAGVRAHILEAVTPFLNARTAHYLTTLSDGTISAVWSTQSKTGKGELREKFNIEVCDSTGGKSFKGLSGGEKRKARLGCAMALQDLVANRATKPIELFMADEIDDALDSAGLERLMTVLNEKAKNKGTVLIVSHGDLNAWIDQVITVTKKDGFSTIEGAV